MNPQMVTDSCPHPGGGIGIAEDEEGIGCLFCERDRLRAKNAELNRRCQTYAAGVAEKLKASGGSFGRSLARAGYAMATARAEAAEAEVAVLRKVEKAARERWIVWTRRTYEALGEAFAELDDFDAKRTTSVTRTALVCTHEPECPRDECPDRGDDV